MLFQVEIDNGDVIGGYVVLDSHNGQGEVAVSRNGEEILRVPADRVREEIRVSGRHETGACGFFVTDAELPGLRDIPDLEIHEPQSGLLIYRRCPADAVVHQKIFRFETQLLPLIRLDRSLRPAFQYYYPSIDRYGQETTYQTFLVAKDSAYISGRVGYKNLEFYIERGYECIALIQDPFDELAERLLVLRLIAGGYKSFLGLRDMVMFEEAIAFAQSLPIENKRELKRAFRDLPPSVSLVLGDPLVRQLTTQLPDESVNAASISGALNILSSFRVLGLRSRPDLFLEALADKFSLDRNLLPAIDQIPAAAALADRLRSCAPVQVLLENDVALFGYLRDAFEKPGTRG